MRQGSGLECPADGLEGVGAGDAELPGSAGEGVRGLGQALLVPAGSVWEALGDERAVTAPADEQPRPFELAVRARHRVRREVELDGENAHRRQPLPRARTPALDPGRERVAELRRERHGRGRVESDPHGLIMRRV